jgi:hypothetical protein
MLEPSDREALCGGLRESGVTDLDALRDVSGLVIRRRMAALRNFRPWVVVTFLGIPLGIFLSVVSLRTADESAIYLWLYTGNLNLGLARMSGYWRVIADCLPIVLLPCLGLVSLSWTAGHLIAVSAKQTRWLSGGGLIGVILCAGTLGFPHSFGLTLALGRARDDFGNAAAFTNPFYRALYPQIIELLLSVIPFLYGLRQRFLVSSLSFR